MLKYYFTIFYGIYISKTCFTLQNQEHQSHKSKQAVLQIWVWYLTKISFQ